jgi:hypothetical protein
MKALALCLLAAGCGATSTEPFLVDTADCAVVNNFKIDNQATPWNDCRVYWAAGTDVLTVELTTPGTSGSFLAPAPAWIRASVQVPLGDVDAMLQSTAHPASTLPSSVAAGEIALDLVVADCGKLASGMSVDTMADVGDRSVSFSMSLSGTCGAHAYSGGFIVSAAAKAGSTATGDPATIVTTPQ